MKTIKQISKIILAFVFLITTINLSAKERRETFEKTYNLSKTGDFIFSCYDTDLKVNTWNKNEVKLTGEILIQGGDEDDQQKLIEVFQNPEVLQSPNSLKIETNLAKNTVVIGFIKTITLVDGKKIRVDKYKVNYELWIPESVAFKLKSKYNNIDIATLTGKIDFDLYDVDLTMLSFGKDSKMQMKYSSAAIGKGGDAILDIYDSEIEAKEMNNVELVSKYSEIEIESINTLDFISYDDDIKIGKINSLKTEAKYSNYRIDGNLKNCIVDFYDSDISIGNVDQLVFSAKYSSLEAGNVKSAKINVLYDSKIELGIVDEFICMESKYDEMELDAITKSLHLNSAYSLELRIDKATASLEEFYGDFKYGSIDVSLDPSLEFNIDFNTTYGDVDFPKDRIKVRDVYIKDDGKQSFEGSTSENAKCNIKFKGYDTDFDLE